MKEILAILIACAVAAIAVGKRLNFPELKNEIPKPHENTCEEQAHLNYLYSYAYLKSDRAIAIKHILESDRIRTICKMNPILKERIAKLKLQLLQ